jgi:hypothetical protein
MNIEGLRSAAATATVDAEQQARRLARQVGLRLRKERGAADGYCLEGETGRHIYPGWGRRQQVTTIDRIMDALTAAFKALRR